MDTISLQFILSFCSNPSVILDRSFKIVARNSEAASLDFQSEQDFLSLCTIEGSPAELVGRCFGSSNKRRFHAVLSSGQQVDAIGWRIGGPFRADNIAMVQFLDVASARTHFVVANKDLQYNKESQKLRLINEGLAASNEKLGVMATKDQMTGLLNASTFRQAVTQKIEDRSAFALIYLDLNGLKQINDMHGHSAGDEAIINLADAIKSCIRNCDIGARLGGDEFAIMATGPLNKAQITGLAGRIQRTLRDSPISQKLSTRHTFKTAIGAALWPQDMVAGKTIEDIADSAMYHSKRVALPVTFAGQFHNAADRSAPRQQSG